MLRIDFLVPGFSKCGTTTLCALLAQHPGIFIPELKEPWYFSAKRFSRDAPGYRRHFLPAQPGQLLGEGSQSYSNYTKEDISIERIYDNNPNCRFIFMARNPLHRIESSYREMHHSGVKFGVNAPYSLAENLERFPQMIKDSLFFERISKYADAFGPGAILVIFLEDLSRNPQAEMEKCFRHLRISTSFQVQQALRLNAGSAKLYDTRLLRCLRGKPWAASRLDALSQEHQDKFLRPLGLRQVFDEPVDWDTRSLAIVRAKVQPDARKFLALYGKSPDFWQF
jgi:hypothetical protein